MDYIGLVFAILASITWGMVYTIDEKILTNISPILWLALSSILTTIILLPVFFANKKEIISIMHSGKNNLLLIFAAQLLIILASFFIFSSIRHLGAASASIFEITYPLFVVLFAWLLFGGTVNAYFWLGGLLIMAGSMVILKYS